MGITLWVRLAALAAVVISVAGTALAADRVDLGVEVRWRPETERVLVGPEGPLRIESLQSLRTRLSADFSPGGTTRARVLLQDSRVMGVPSSGTILPDSNAGVHEAYFEIGDFFARPLTLRAGRFELNYGNQRLLGGVGWSNVGRTFDVARLSFVQPSWQLDFLGAKRVARQTGPNDDTRLYGAYMQLTKMAESDLFLLLDYDGRKVGSARAQVRWTAGTYAAREIRGNLDYIFNGAYQFGTFASGADTTVDISAFLLALELGYTMGQRTSTRAALGIDYVSGDDPESADFEAFNNLYYTAHKFRGFMDQFLLSNREGLIDTYGRLRVKPHAEWTIGADFHFFQTARSFTSLDDGGSARNAAFEVDAVLRTTKLEHAALELGGALFKPTRDWVGPDDDVRLWGYLQITARLP
jgi:hypothetical protein